MFLLAEAAIVVVRPFRSWPVRAVAIAALGVSALSACTSLGADHGPAPVAAAASAPAVGAAVPPPPVTADAASAPKLTVVEPVEPPTADDRAARQLLAYHEQVRALPPNELVLEITRLTALPPAPDASLELAMALLQSRNGGELGRAIGLVEPIAKAGAAEQRPWQPFARLLLARLLEQRRLEDLVDKRNQDLRDSQREVRQLNEKLEALKAIERSLTPRPSSSLPVPGAAGTTSFAPASQATSPRRTP